MGPAPGNSDVIIWGAAWVSGVLSSPWIIPVCRQACEPVTEGTGHLGEQYKWWWPGGVKMDL